MPDARTLQFYNDQATTYLSRNKSRAPDADLRAFMDLLPDGAHVLDLGCGPATASAHMRAAGFDPDPVDAAPGMVNLANETHDIGARVMQFHQLDAHAHYDAVWANFSLLHAPRAALAGHLAAIHTALRPGGILHTGMKTGSDEQRDSLGRLYTYVSHDEWSAMLGDAGFSILTTRTGSGQGCAGTLDPFVITLARKHG